MRVVPNRRIKNRSTVSMDDWLDELYWDCDLYSPCVLVAIYSFHHNILLDFPGSINTSVIHGYCTIRARTIMVSDHLAKVRNFHLGLYIDQYISFFRLVTGGWNTHLNILLLTILHKVGFAYASAGTLEDNKKEYMAGDTEKRIQTRHNLPTMRTHRGKEINWEALTFATCKNTQPNFKSN